MNARHSILIVTTDALSGLGLKTLLAERFGQTATWAPCWDDIDSSESTSPELLTFCDAASLPSIPVVLAGRKGRVVVLRDDDDEHERHRTLNIRTPYDTLIENIGRILTETRSTRTPASSQLSTREIAVLTLMARGLINKEIAAQLSISIHTVISHRKHISAKLGIRSVSGLTVYATIHGYVEPETVV